MRVKVLGDDHRFTGESYFSLGWMLALRGRENDLAESDSLLHLALENYRRNLGNEHPAMAYVYHAIAMLEERRGNLEEAERRFRQALSIRRAATRDNPRVTVQTLIALGQLQRRRSSEDAAALLRAADSLASQRLADNDPIRAEAAAALRENR
jgi:tetratricopeptide (TPR) repeat protein